MYAHSRCHTPCQLSPHTPLWPAHATPLLKSCSCQVKRMVYDMYDHISSKGFYICYESQNSALAQQLHECLYSLRRKQPERWFRCSFAPIQPRYTSECVASEIHVLSISAVASKNRDFWPRTDYSIACCTSKFCAFPKAREIRARILCASKRTEATLSKLAPRPSVCTQRAFSYQSVASPWNIAFSTHALMIALLVALRNSALSQKLEK